LSPQIQDNFATKTSYFAAKRHFSWGKIIPPQTKYLRWRFVFPPMIKSIARKIKLWQHNKSPPNASLPANFFPTDNKFNCYNHKFFFWEKMEIATKYNLCQRIIFPKMIKLIATSIIFFVGKLEIAIKDNLCRRIVFPRMIKLIATTRFFFVGKMKIAIKDWDIWTLHPTFWPLIWDGTPCFKSLDFAPPLLTIYVKSS